MAERRSRLPRVVPLTAFLLRRGIKDPEEAIGGKVGEELDEVAVRRDLGFDARLFVRRAAQRHPWWEAFLAEGAASRIVVQTRTGGAVLFVRAQRHLFAFTFGTGRFALDPSSYERDFGLRVTLNAVDPKSLRSVDMQTVEELTLLTRRQASRRSGLEVFELDEVRDMLRGVVGEPLDPDVALVLAGSDRLAFHARLRFNDLAAKCAEFFTLYNGTEYKKHFDFIDHMRRVEEPDLEQQPDGRLVDALNRRALDTIHLAPPEPLDWEDFGGFRYQPLEKAGLRSDLDITEFLDAFAGRYDRALEIKDLRRGQRVLVISAASGDSSKHWSVYDAVVAELEFGGARYELSAGDWYEVDKTFAEATAHAIGEIAVCAIAFPSSPKGEEERDYLVRAKDLLTEGEGVRFALLDRELVACAGAPSQMEVCDLFSQIGQFVHVKRRTASATLSHLFAQGTGSATAFINDKLFRQGARAKLPADWDNSEAFPDDVPDARDYSVIYAVIAPGQQPLAQVLPFLSQVSLMYAARALRTMGFRLELAHIEETPPA